MRLILVGWILAACAGAVLGADMKIAILRDTFPEKAGFADPEKLAEILRQAQDGRSKAQDDEAGVLRQAQGAQDGVEFVSAEQLADANAFSASKYWLVVLPYGPYFPAEARDNFLAYLRAGGDFLSTGGYAFDSPAVRWQGQWLTLEDVLRIVPTSEVNIGDEHNADMDYLTGEWNGPEDAGGEWGDSGDRKRWSGKNAGIRLVVDPAESYTLEIRVSVNQFAAASKWRLTVNGKPFTDIPAGSGQVLKVRLGPKEFAGKREVEIGFDGKLWRPSEVTNSPDTRLLGIAVGRVRLIPDGQASPKPNIDILRRPINMRHGKPEDFLEWDKAQLGVFDAGYRLTGGKSIVPAPDQHIVPAGFTVKGKVEGWAAAGTTGSDWYWTAKTRRSRLIPLLQTLDEYGRFRGNAGSLMVNTLEPYRGSIWAYFGVESFDLFSKPGAEELLAGLVNAMKRGAFVHDLHPSYACYRQGEEARIIGSVSNFGAESLSCMARIDITDESGSPVHSESIHVDLAPGETKQISTTWHPGVFGDDFYIARADLLVGDEPVDTARTGFYAWNETTVANGMQLSYSGNYLRDDGRPRYMLGVQAFYDRYCPAGMNPLDVERDFRDMADMGIHIARTFTYSDDETDWRFRDALVMAAARHRVAFWLSGTIYMRGYLDNPASISIAHQIGKRHKGIRGMFIDLFNEPDWHNREDAQRDARFNDYLRAKYGSDQALRAAWGDELGANEKLGSLKMGWITNDWTSVRSRDIYQFLCEQGAKWVTDVTGAIKVEDPSRLVSCGYLGWWNGMMMDPVVTSDALDFVDRHHYFKMSNARGFDAQLAVTDRRYCGKAPSIGEFGSKTYPTFKETGHNYDTVEQQELRYLHVGHYTLALGGIFASNWHWRDPQSCIFPYGIIHSDFTPKPVTKAYRAMSLLFSSMRPKYVEPEVYLVLPDESRFGGRTDRITEAMMRAANGLIDARLRFGTINEWDLDKLPKSAKLLVLPAPFALSSAGYERLKAFVESGGVLYVSGDFSYDEDRRRTKTDRLEELAGVKFVEERYPNILFEKGERQKIRYDNALEYTGYPSMEFEPARRDAVIAWAGNRPVAVVNHFSKGKVFFSSDPAEFLEDSPLGAIYLRAAREAGVEPEKVTPNVKGIQVFRLPCEDGEAVMLGNAGEKAAKVSVTVGGREYTLTVGANRQAMLVTKGGKLTGLEAQGNVSRGGKTILSAKNHFFAVALDNRDLADSREIAFVALRPGRYSLNRTGLTAECGELRGGKWHTLKALGESITVPEGLAGDVVLAAASSAIPHARQTVAVLLAK